MKQKTMRKLPFVLSILYYICGLFFILIGLILQFTPLSIFGAILIVFSVAAVFCFSLANHNGDKIASRVLINETLLADNGFTISKICKFQVSLFYKNNYSAIYVDDENKKCVVYWRNGKCTKKYDFAELNSFEIFQNEESQISGRAGSALVGGLFFGAGGAVVGASRSKNIVKTCSSLQLRIRVSDLSHPEIIINLINYMVSTKSKTYKNAFETAKELCSNIEYMMKCNKEIPTSKNEQVQYSSTTELREYKKLFDDGIITKDEFESKKNQLLNK